jgi:glucokinase
LGGSHVSVGKVDTATGRLEDAERIEIDPTWPRARLVEFLEDAAHLLAGTDCIGAAVPGPFDYEQGICTIHGVGKLDVLYGVDLRALIASAARVQPRAVRFLNDAQAFVLGEAVIGAARNERRIIGITLGTGLGSAFLEDGSFVISGSRVPDEGELYRVPFRGRAVEEVISGRGLIARYDGSTPPAEIATRADAGDSRAASAYTTFGEDLAAFLEPWTRRFQPTRIVVGGSIAHAWHLFGSMLGPTATVADHLADAALLGAAAYAANRT